MQVWGRGSSGFFWFHFLLGVFLVFWGFFDRKKSILTCGVRFLGGGWRNGRFLTARMSTSEGFSMYSKQIRFFWAFSG